MRTSVAAVLGLSVALAGCSSPTAPAGSLSVTRVIVSGTGPVVGASLQFTATAVMSDDSRQDVTATATWVSSNTAVLTVSPSGMVTGVAVGTANVTATFQSVDGSTAATIGTLSCSLTVSPQSSTIPKEGGTVTINVIMTSPAQCAWDAITANPFITIVSGSSGVGNGTIVATVAPNSGLGREGSIVVAKQLVVQVFQKQADCVTNLTPVPASLPATGGLVQINVTAPPGCTWTGIETSWQVKFLGIPSGSGNGFLEVVAGPNGTGSTRINQVKVEQLTVSFAQGVPQAGTFFAFTSGFDVIGHGWDVVSEAPPYSITASAASTSEANFVSVVSTPHGGTQKYYLTLRAPSGQALTTGTYANATGIAGSPSLPFLNLRYETTDCGPTGEFTVHDVLYGPGPSIVRFWATFQQRCPSSPTAILRGEISFGR